MASAAKCGTLLWKSSAPKVVPDLMAPVRKPLPNELHGMFPANSLRARFGQADVFHFPFHNQLFTTPATSLIGTSGWTITVSKAHTAQTQR